MNPDAFGQAAYNAGYERARAEYESKRARSRASQPKRKNTRKGHRK